MALIKCADCGRDISDAAPACPNCGRPKDPPIVVPEPPRCRSCNAVLEEGLACCIKCGNDVAGRAEKSSEPQQAAAPPLVAAPSPGGCLKGCLGVFVLWVIFVALVPKHEPPPAASKPLTPSTLPTPVWPVRTPPPLEVQSWSWREEYGYAIAEGAVKNVSSAPIENLQAVVSFSTKDGTFIASDDALVAYNPLLPGQTSPFKVMARHNPAMSKAGLSFKSLFGGEVESTRKTKK